MSTYDLSFTIREIRTAHLAFPDTPGYWEQDRRQNDDLLPSVKHANASTCSWTKCSTAVTNRF